MNSYNNKVIALACRENNISKMRRNKSVHPSIFDLLFKNLSLHVLTLYLIAGVC